MLQAYSLPPKPPVGSLLPWELSKDNFLSFLLERIVALDGWMFGSGWRDSKRLPSRDTEASTCGIEVLLSRLKAAVILGEITGIRRGDQSWRSVSVLPGIQCWPPAPTGSGGRGHEPSHRPCVLCGPVASCGWLCGLLWACSQVADGSAGFWSLLVLPPLLPHPAGAVQLQTPGFWRPLPCQSQPVGHRKIALWGAYF